MKQKLILLLFLCFVATGEAKRKPVVNDPVSDKLRFEIAIAQRDFVSIQGPYIQALNKLRDKVSEAEKVCQVIKKRFSPDTFECIEIPVPPIQPAPIIAPPSAPVKPIPPENLK
jgi:hypothetical protein